MSTRPRALTELAVAVVLAGCSPALDWREFVPEGSGLHVTFPCRPDRSARRVALAGATVPMQMLACAAGDATFAVAFADVADPARVADALAELQRAAVGNVGGGAPVLAPLQIAGMTPNAQTTRLSVDGRLPDGAPVREHAAFFARGLRVYQASVIGAQPAPADVEVFIAGLRFPP
ncbi:MAG TPA: hypothetical protein VNU71_06025 [Burkholderiaceae bacterium]|nr:hypothetical protein [Burkholderiaceae bacterium]